MMERKKVKAVKNGRYYVFSQKAWKIGNHTQHGFRLVGEVDEKDKIAVEAVEVSGKDKEKVELGEVKEIVTVEIPDEKVVEKDSVVVAEEKHYPSDDEIKKFLNTLADEGKIKRPHHALGTKKLRKIYDENTK